MSESGTSPAIRQIDANTLVVGFDPSVYRLAAIKKAVYRLGDRLSASIRVAKNGTIETELILVDSSPDIDRLLGDLCREALDQELREQIAEETAGIRDLLLSQAFSATSLIDREGDEGNYMEDPKGIRGVP